MILKNTIRLIPLQLLVLFSSVTFAQNVEKKYNHQMATAELEHIQANVKSGISFELNPEVFRYIYENINTFPTMPTDARLQERMQSLILSYTQLTFILKSLVIESRDSVSIEQAMISASLGYQSVKLLSLGNEFMHSLDKNDPSFALREKGYNQGTIGIQDFLMGYVITTFLENKYQGVDEILTSSLIDFAPNIIDKLPTDKKKSLIDLIKNTVGNKNDIRLKNEYQEFIDLL